MSMDVDTGSDALQRAARDGSVEAADWPAMRAEIIDRLDKIVHNDFPIPNLPPPPSVTIQTEPQVSPLPSSPLEGSSQNANNENGASEQSNSTQSSDSSALPKQVADMVNDIVTKLGTFETWPPHTIQRLAELILQPRRHYRALASYLHAVDRVVQVTSGTNIYPLEICIPRWPATLNGEDEDGVKDPAAAISWTNSTAPSLGSDEALGGALLTPISWLTRRSPEGNSEARGAQIHSESTETIDGPNGMGSIETVSVRVNGVTSAQFNRAITQGELLRQEQRAGVVPVTQLSRAQEGRNMQDDMQTEAEDEEPAEEEEEIPHARGPEEIGMSDTGPQSVTTSHVGEGGLEMQDIDVEAAVGRKHEDDIPVADEESEGPERHRSPSTESVGSKREAEEDLEGEPARKKREESDKSGADSDSPTAVTADETEVVHRTRESKTEEESEDKMDTEA